MSAKADVKGTFDALRATAASHIGHIQGDMITTPDAAAQIGLVYAVLACAVMLESIDDRLSK